MREFCIIFAIVFSGSLGLPALIEVDSNGLPASEKCPKCAGILGEYECRNHKIVGAKCGRCGFVVRPRCRFRD